MMQQRCGAIIKTSKHKEQEMQSISQAKISVKFMPGVVAEKKMTAEDLIKLIFSKNDFRNLQIDDGINGYELVLSHEQLSFQPEIVALENCGWFSSVAYTEESINIQLNEHGSQEFLKIFILH